MMSGRHFVRSRAAMRVSGWAVVAILLGLAGPTHRADSQDAEHRVAPSQEDRIFFARRLGEDAGWSILSRNGQGADERVEVSYAGGQGEYNPASSPDGRTLVFNTYRYGGWKLATTQLGTPTVTRWTPGADYYTNGVFSPDGTLIAYEANRRSGTTLEVRSVAGGDVLQAMRDSEDPRAPAWTPDGKALIYFAEVDGRQQILRYELASSKRTQLSRSAANDFGPAVAPDGQSVAFFSDRDGYSDLFVMHIDGSRQTNLTGDSRNPDGRYTFSGRSYWNLKASWSPDGTEIVFTAPRDGNYELFVIKADGAGLRRITTTPESEITPFWGEVRN